MKTISRILCSFALFSVACDDGREPADRAAELPEILVEQGWYVDEEGELVREHEDGTIERALANGELVYEEPTTPAEDGPMSIDPVDDLTAPTDPAAATGVWTALPGLESCQDLFAHYCSATIPLNQCIAGSTCYAPGSSCYQVMSKWSVKSLICK